MKIFLFFFFWKALKLQDRHLKTGSVGLVETLVFFRPNYNKCLTFLYTRTYEPRHEKTQTGLLNYRDYLESCNFSHRIYRNSTN